MDNRARPVLLLTLAALVLLAGCALPQDTEEEPEELVLGEVQCSSEGRPCTDVRPEGTVTINWEMTYNAGGNITVHLNTPRDEHKLGLGVMKNFCTVFDRAASGFEAIVISPRVRNNVSEQETVTLTRGQTLRLEWTLPVREGEVPQLGASCPVDFAVRYTHIVDATKQIQIRRDESVPPVSDLEADTASPTPVQLQIDAETSFLAGTPIFTELFLRNTGAGEILNVSYIEARLEKPEQQSRCIDRNVFMLQGGRRRGQSSRLSCDAEAGFIVEEGELGGVRSQTFRIRAEGKYTYEQEVGNVLIEVTRRG